MVCIPKCNLKLPCREGYFCSRLTGDLEDYGKCIKSTKCPRSPPFSNGILAPDVSGVLGSKATFRCPSDKRFIMIDYNRKWPMGNGTVHVKCTSQGWKLSDGSNGEIPVCIQGNIIYKTNKLKLKFYKRNIFCYYGMFYIILYVFEIFSQPPSLQMLS